MQKLLVSGQPKCLRDGLLALQKLKSRAMPWTSGLSLCWVFSFAAGVRLMPSEPSVALNRHCLKVFLEVGLGNMPAKFGHICSGPLNWHTVRTLPLSGIVADIRKAFNYLPRAVVFEACALLGIPFRVLRAWAGALASLPRRFQINGSIGPEVLSTCGLPEGVRTFLPWNDCN